MADPAYMRDARPVTPDYMRNARPVIAPPDPSVIAHGASDAPSAQAAKALDISAQTGLAPNYAAENLDEATKAQDKQRFETMLTGRPILAQWASQSPQHAAVAKADIEPLSALEDWISGLVEWKNVNALRAGLRDILHAEAMREYMGFAADKARSQDADYVEAKVQEFASGGRDPAEVAAFRQRLQNPVAGPLADRALALESSSKEYDAQSQGYMQQIIRAAPQMAMYAGAGTVAGPAGLAGLLYTQNKGVLARQIQQAQPTEGGLTPEEIDKYATIGSGVSATVLAGLLGPLLRSLPGAKELLQRVGAGVLSRAAATTVGQSAIRNLLAYGQHTAMGALGMALQGTINKATVQKATGEDLDVEQLIRETADDFIKVLPVAATFAAYGPAKDFAADRGRINAAPTERVYLDVMIELAKEAQLTKTSGDRAAELFGLMGRGVKVYIDHVAAQKMEGLPPADVAAAEVSQGSVAVPAGEYLARMADQHEAVKDDVKLSPNGMTMNEARARDKELRGKLPPEVAEALLGKTSPDDALQFELPFPKTEEKAAPPVEKAPPAELKFQASFQNKETGAVINTGPFHDLSQLPGGTNAHASGKFTDGFTDQNGKFYTRDEAAKALNVKGQELASGGLATEDLARMEKEKYAAVAEEMAKQYGGSVEEWQKRLTPELIAALREEGSKGAISPEEHAARVIEAMPVGDIDPEQYGRLAKKSEKYIQEAAEKARSGSAAGAKAYSPADVAILSTHELARDVNRAKEAKAAEVKAEMDKISSTLTKQAADNKLRGLIGRAGKPLLDLFNALTGSTIGGSELDEAKQWFADAARPIAFNEKMLEKTLADPKPFSEMRPAEVRNIADAVKQITKAAREENIVRAKDAEATVADAAAEISGELRQNPDKGLPQPSGVPSGFWRNRAIDANAANAQMLRPKNNLRQKSTAAVKWIFDRINEAVYARDGLFRSIGEQWKAAFEGIPADIAKRRYETYDLSDKLPSPGTEPLKNVPRQWLWKMARHWMSAGNMDVVSSTSGWDKDVIGGILFDDPKTKLTVPEWDYLQSLADVNEKSIWPKLKEHGEKFYGQAPPKTAAVPFRVKLEDGTWKDYAGGYEPLKRDARPGVAPQAEPTKGIAQYWGGNFQVPWTPAGAKARVENAHYLVNMDWDSSRASIGSVLHWLAFDQPVRDVAKLLNDQGLAADMNQYMGQGRADAVRGWLKSSATRQAQSGTEGMDVVGRMFGWQRRLQLMQIVGGSARLATAQLTHPIGLMLGGEVNPIHGFPAFFSTFKPFTMENGEVRLFPNWNDAITYGKEVQHRADNAYMTLRRTWDQAGPPPGPIGALKSMAQRTAGLYLHAVDRLTTSWAWTAFHNEAIAKFKMEPFSDEAVAYADGKTQDVMPVHDIETAAPILTNRQMGGFLIMHGFKNTLYNMRQDALSKSVQDFHLAETPGEYSSAAAKTAGRIGLQLAMFGGFAVMGKFALGYGQQSEEDKGQWLARDFLSGQAADIPLVGGLAEPIAKWMTGGHVNRQDFTLYGNPGMALANKAAELLGKLVSTGREDYKKVFDALEAVLFFSGVPSRPTRTTAEHLYEMLAGEGYDDPESSAGDTAGRMFYTEKQWESIKRSLTPDE